MSNTKIHISRNQHSIHVYSQISMHGDYLIATTTMDLEKWAQNNWSFFPINLWISIWLPSAILINQINKSESPIDSIYHHDLKNEIYQKLWSCQALSSTKELESKATSTIKYETFIVLLNLFNRNSKALARLLCLLQHDTISTLTHRPLQLSIYVKHTEHCLK